MILSIILFIIQTKQEEKKRDYVNSIFNSKALTDKLTYSDILGAYSKLVSLCKERRLNFFNRLFIFLNYILWISLYILVNFSITFNTEMRLGDRLFLIISLVLVFLFSAPILKQLFIYMFVSFGPGKSDAYVEDENAKDGLDLTSRRIVANEHPKAVEYNSNGFHHK